MNAFGRADTTVSTRRRRSRLTAAIVAAAVAVAACGGGDDSSSATTPATDATPATTEAPPPDTTDAAPATTEATNPTTAPTTAPATTPETTAAATGTVVITSADGNLTLEVSAADAERVEPSIRILEPSEWPPELGDADQLPGVTIYEMEPDGAEFDEPVTVTRRLDVASFGDDIELLTVPLVVPFTQEKSGQFVPLADLSVTRVGDALFASGTTTHFSPLGMLNLGFDVRWPDAPVVVDQTTGETFDAAAIERLQDQLVDGKLDLPSASIETITALSGQMPEVASTQANPPDSFPTFGSTEVTEVAPMSPAQSVERAAIAMYELLSTSTDVPGSALFGVPGVEVPPSLQIAVIQYIFAVQSGADDATLDRLEDVADVLAAGVGLTWGVTHSFMGGFPSFSRITLSDVPEAEAGVSLYAANFTGTPGAGAQVIDVAEMMWDGEGYAADVGLASYGDISQAVVIIDGEAPPAVTDGRGNEFWEFFAMQPDVGVVMTVTDTTTGATQVFTVGPDEGVGFDGPVGFEIYDGP